MKKILKPAMILGSVISSYFFAGIAFASPLNGGQNVTLCDPLGTNCQFGGETFTSVSTAVIQFLFQDIAIPLSVVMILVGAFQIMTASGDPEKFSKGRKTITYAAIGLVAAFIALGADKIIQSLLGVS